MARIAGITLPKDKRAQIALTYIYGIGRTTANKILTQTKIDPNVRIKDLTETQINQLREFIDKNIRVEGELKREVLLNVKRLKEIDSYRGSRHSKHLPVRGQRTKTNNRTVRGNVRRTMGSGKKPPAQKT
ncbi:MAG: 30S ribosomal protein S13 [Patescibacteria group bacterium]|jgi:small subunit ribosomal protein S13|nr:30S ribosomal protein S13 [Patescibacteria group bacterium]